MLTSVMKTNTRIYWSASLRERDQIMATKIAKRSGTSPRKQAEDAGRNIRGGKTIIGARRSRDEKLGSIMDELSGMRGKKK